MKKMFLVWSIAGLLFQSCNNEAKDSVAKADSTNDAKSDQMPDEVKVDEATSDFLVKAADGGMAEVEAGKIGEAKATDAGIKKFSTMMVQDHTGANAKVKSLADARNVFLPAVPSAEHQKAAADVSQKTGKNFDKSYMEMMVDDHQKTIDLFEKAADNSKDTEVVTFINTTLPTLKMHLESAKALLKGVK